MPPRKTKATARAVRKESDLAQPIQRYLTEQGYTVRSEVKGCDLTAVRAEELVVVELKLQFSTDLLIQAIERQRVAEAVYVGLPFEGAFGRRDRYSKRWRGIEQLLKRLELGLIVVCFPQNAPEEAPTIEVVQHPVPEVRVRRKHIARKSILREISGRAAGDYNVGGTSRQALTTAYREQCVLLACCLERFGPQKPAQLRKRFNTSAKTQTMLLRNVYGWFDRLDRGVYGLNPNGLAELETGFAHVAAYYRQQLDALGEKASEPLSEPAVAAGAAKGIINQT